MVSACLSLKKGVTSSPPLTPGKNKIIIFIVGCRLRFRNA